MPAQDTVQRSRPSVPTALRRGLARRCPACGEGSVFTGYVAPAAVCARCGEALGKFRADDAPAYFTIFIVGHLIVPLMLFAETAYHPSSLTHALLWVPLTLALTLALLPVVKGAVIGANWAFSVRD